MIREIKPRNLYWNKWSHYVRVGNPFFRFYDIRKQIKKNNWYIDEEWIENRLLISRQIVFEKYRNIIPYDVIEFKNFIKTMRRYCQQHGNIEKFRFENRYCTMYTNDDQLEQIFKSRLISIIDGVSKPVNEKHEKMMRESAEKCHERFKEKIVSSLPKNGFQYKINLFNLHGLIRKYPNMSGVLLDYDKEGLCILPERCKAALSESTSKYIWATHMYVKDEDTLNLLLLMLDHSNIHDIEVFKTF